MKRTLLSGFFLLTALVSLMAMGGGEAETTPVDEPLVVAMELQFPPFEMTDADGEPSGISVDMAYALGEALGRPVVIENTAWAGLIPALRTGKVDLVLSSMTITEERDEVIDFSTPYAASSLSLLVAAESPVTTPQDLENDGITLAVKAGTTGEILARENYPNATIRVFDTVSACVLEVAQAKADAFIYDQLTVYENWKSNPETTRLILTPIPGTQGYWGVGIAQDNTELKEAVDAFILSYRESGGFQSLGEKYLGEVQELFAQQGVPFFFDL